MTSTSINLPAHTAAPGAPVTVGVVMGSNSDWETMQHAVQILQQFGVAYEARVVSAHRMPDALFAYAEAAAGRGLQAIIAGAGGAAHLPGMLAAKTCVPVLGVPVASKHLQGVDSLHSIVQMPKGIPVATFAIGNAGAANAALFAVALLALHERVDEGDDIAQPGQVPCGGRQLDVERRFQRPQQFDGAERNDAQAGQRRVGGQPIRRQLVVPRQHGAQAGEGRGHGWCSRGTNALGAR